MRHTLVVPASRYKSLTRCLLAAVLALACALHGASAAHAQTPSDGLALGELSIRIDSGYQGYALPIANAALARRWTGTRQFADDADWALAGGLAYQLAYDYSTVPVRVRIEHRRPESFRGRIEVLSAHGFHSSEQAGGNFATVSQEFNAAPGVPLEFCLAPRCCPPSRPGGPLRLLVRLYQRGVETPLREFEQQVLQFEPAHLYSLLLDGAPGAVIEQRLNADNRLDLNSSWQPPLDPAIGSSMHYLYSCDRQALTLLPLAARQFAFAAADLSQVESWPETEQRALLAYALGGGRLLLFNTAGHSEWQGLELRAVQPLGRGWLLAEPGGQAAAAARLQRWLEGELEEFMLHSGGTVRGQRLDERFTLPYSRGSLRLDHIFGIPEVESADQVSPLSHRAGFYHPLWILRTASDSAALEPWDYPEFSQSSGSLVGNNANLRLAAMDIPPAQLPRSLPGLSAGAQHLPPWWLAVLWAAFAAATCVLLIVRRRALLSASLLTLAYAGLILLLLDLGGHTQQTTSLALVLTDYDAASPLAIERLVQSNISPARQSDLRLPADTLLRRVDSSACNSWELIAASLPHAEHAASHWRASGLGSYAALRCDSLVTATTPPVELRLAAANERELVLELDCHGLSPDTPLLLQSSLGWQALRSTSSPQRVNLPAATVPLEPGLARQLALQEQYRRRQLQLMQNRNAPSSEAYSLLAQQLAAEWPSHRVAGQGADELQRLGWCALLQDPLLGRGMPLGQAVLYYPLDVSATPGEHRAVWMRQTLTLPAATVEPDS